MKSVILVVVVFLGAQVSMADEILSCSRQDGSFVYESLTVVGDKVVIEDPRLMIAGKAIDIHVYNTESGRVYAGGSVCKAMGLADGFASDVRLKIGKTARFYSSGELVSVSESEPGAALKTLVCKKSQ